jgi:hypothetical protein
VESVDLAQGNLASVALSELLSTIASRGETGVLAVEGKGHVWFDEGRTYLAAAPTSPELATVLFDASVGTPEAVAELLQTEGLVDGGKGGAIERLLIDHPDAEADLRRLLHEYTLNSLFEMLVPSDAAFEFLADEVHPIGARFAEDTGELIDKAEQRLEIWRRIAARIPSTSAVFTLSTSLPDGTVERVVSADEWRFLSLLDGRNTVAEVINETGESAFRVCSALYRLLLEEVIVEAEPSTS